MQQGRFDFTAEDLKVFLQEAEEQLQLLDGDIVRLEREADNVDLLQEIFRAAHTLKGSSAMLGLDKMAELTHAMEDLLDGLRKGTLPVTVDLVDHLLQGLDALKVLKDDTAAGQESTIEVAPLVAGLRSVGDSSTVPAKQPGRLPESGMPADAAVTAKLRAAAIGGKSAYLVRLAIDEQSEWLAVRCFQAFNELTERSEVICSVPSIREIEEGKGAASFEALLVAAAVDDLQQALEAIDDVREVSIKPWQPNAAGPMPASEYEAYPKAADEHPEASVHKIETLQTVRIDVERLDELMNMVGELVIERTRLSQINRDLQSRYREDEIVQALAYSSGHLVKVVDALNESMMQVRMVPIGTLFSKFPRLVRDLAHTVGKNVEFVVEGQDTEIDRSVIEKIKDPLVHMLRNAVDHGIEAPAARKAAGKSEQALIRLSAYHEQGHILIKVEDDGKGVDARSVRESALKRGAVTAEAAERLADSEAVNLIFESGISTAEQTTEVSGRGVGMDVVKKGIEACNGLIELNTEVGVGTTLTLRLPLTLATFEGLLVSSGGTAYAIPVNYVQETVKLQPELLATIMGREVVNLRGNVMPLARLSVICSQHPASGTTIGDDESDYLVVVKAGDRNVALAVDDLMEQQEIVVKSLGRYMGRTSGVSGASILGDGRVVLILDMATLVKTAA